MLTKLNTKNKSLKKAILAAESRTVYKRSIVLKTLPEIQEKARNIKKLISEINNLEELIKLDLKNNKKKTDVLNKKQALFKLKIQLKTVLINQIIEFHGLKQVREAKDIKELTDFFIKNMNSVNLIKLNSNLTAILKKLNAAKLTNLENNLHNIVLWLEDLKKEIECSCK